MTLSKIVKAIGLGKKENNITQTKYLNLAANQNIEITNYINTLITQKSYIALEDMIKNGAKLTPNQFLSVFNIFQDFIVTGNKHHIDKDGKISNFNVDIFLDKNFTIQKQISSIMNIVFSPEYNYLINDENINKPLFQDIKESSALMLSGFTYLLQGNLTYHKSTTFDFFQLEPNINFKNLITYYFKLMELSKKIQSIDLQILIPIEIHLLFNDDSFQKKNVIAEQDKESFLVEFKSVTRKIYPEDTNIISSLTYKEIPSYTINKLIEKNIVISANSISLLQSGSDYKFNPYKESIYKQLWNPLYSYGIKHLYSRCKDSQSITNLNTHFEDLRLKLEEKTFAKNEEKPCFKEAISQQNHQNMFNLLNKDRENTHIDFSSFEPISFSKDPIIQKTVEQTIQNLKMLHVISKDAEVKLLCENIYLCLLNWQELHDNIPAEDLDNLDIKNNLFELFKESKKMIISHHENIFHEIEKNKNFQAKINQAN